MPASSADEMQVTLARQLMCNVLRVETQAEVQKSEFMQDWNKT